MRVLISQYWFTQENVVIKRKRLFERKFIESNRSQTQSRTASHQVTLYIFRQLIVGIQYNALWKSPQWNTTDQAHQNIPPPPQLIQLIWKESISPSSIEILLKATTMLSSNGYVAAIKLLLTNVGKPSELVQTVKKSNVQKHFQFCMSSTSIIKLIRKRSCYSYWREHSLDIESCLCG